MRRRFTLPEQRIEAARELAADVAAARSELVTLRRAVGLPAAFVFVATPVNLSTPDRLSRLQAHLRPRPRCVGVRLAGLSRRGGSGRWRADWLLVGTARPGNGAFCQRGRLARIGSQRSCRPICGRDARVPRTPPSVAGAVPGPPPLRFDRTGVRPREPIPQREMALGLDMMPADERFGNMCGADGWPQGSLAGHGPGGSRPSGGTRMNAGGIR